MHASSYFGLENKKMHTSSYYGPENKKMHTSFCFGPSWRTEGTTKAHRRHHQSALCRVATVIVWAQSGGVWGAGVGGGYVPAHLQVDQHLPIIRRERDDRHRGAREQVQVQQRALRMLHEARVAAARPEARVAPLAAPQGPGAPVAKAVRHEGLALRPLALRVRLQMAVDGLCGAGEGAAVRLAVPPFGGTRAREGSAPTGARGWGPRIARDPPPHTPKRGSGTVLTLTPRPPRSSASCRGRCCGTGQPNDPIDRRWKAGPSFGNDIVSFLLICCFLFFYFFIFLFFYFFIFLFFYFFPLRTA